ncbi:MAG: SIR2 family protein [Acidobacteriota bacterium]
MLIGHRCKRVQPRCWIPTTFKGVFLVWPREEFIRNNQRRDILFVFGAGASHAEGAPLQSQILPFILDEEGEIAQSSTGGKVIGFLKDHFGWDREQRIYPTLEVIFAFLDYFIYRNESLGGQYTNGYIREIRESLVKLIHYSVSKVSSPRKGVYSNFWRWVKTFDRNISVLTTNYDTFIDEGFDSLYPAYGFLDYSIHLMNHEYYRDIEPYDLLINPGEIEPRFGPSHTSPKAVRLVKIHGSLNWKYCNCCNQVLLTPWSTEVDLESERLEPACDDGKGRHPCTCPLDGTPFQTLIVPPANIKLLDHPTINTLVNNASREIRMARRIVFIGYSFPDADIYLKAVFKKNLRDDVKITVVNCDRGLKVQKAYEPLARHVEFIWGPFEDVVRDGDTMERIFNVG